MTEKATPAQIAKADQLRAQLNESLTRQDGPNWRERLAAADRAREQNPS